MNDLNFSILVNTTDSFEDCWTPFFTLFKKYWPDYNGKIYLNTETKYFEFPGLNIISIQNNKATPSHKITWSQCLSRALKAINEEVVLYMQEDYFLKNDVKNDLVLKFANLMHDNKNIDCIHLTDQAVIPEDVPSDFEGLYNVKLKQAYRISCQTALWKKETLLKYVRPFENAWQFEKFGSKRAVIYKHNFFVVDKDWVKLGHFEIIPYVFTGIIQGRWKEEVVTLFEENNIHIDYAKRGFHKQSHKRTVKMKLIKKWKTLPIEIKSYIDLIKLKNK